MNKLSNQLQRSQDQERSAIKVLDEERNQYEMRVNQAKREMDRLEQQFASQLQYYSQKESSQNHLDKENRALLSKLAKLEANEQSFK